MTLHSRNHPDEWPDEDLAALLSEALGETVRPGSITKRVTLIKGTYPKELVNVDVAGGPNRHFFIKYGCSLDRDDRDARGGVTYETRVYTELLARLDVNTVKFHGHVTQTDSATILLLDGLPDAIRVHESAGARGVVAAAAWLGSFHRQASLLAEEQSLDWMQVYSNRLLQKWCEVDGRDGAMPEYVRALAYLAEHAVPELLAGPASIIHGEFYPKNILFYEEEVYPIDWESAAIGPAELDLAMLIDNWGRVVRDAALERYAAARLQHAAPTTRRRLHLAEMILHARWLSWVQVTPDMAGRPRRRFDALMELLEEVA